MNGLRFSKYKNNSLIFIYDPFTKVDDLNIILNKISRLKNNYLVYKS